jgi:Family of unknown function (DUF6356)
MSQHRAFFKDKLGSIARLPVAVWREYQGLSGGKGMTARMMKLFTDHPAAVDETYVGHMGFAGWFAGRLFMAGGAALVHAFLPFLFETIASRIVRELYERTYNRGRR